MTPHRRALVAAIVVPVRVYLGAVFVVAAAFKIARPYDFALSVATYQILPLAAVNLVAILLPWIELAVGVALVVGFWSRAAGVLASGLLALFLVAIASALLRGLQLSCGCFASQEAAAEIGMTTLLRDAGWLLLAGLVAWLEDGRFGLDRFWNRAPLPKGRP